MSGKNIIFDDKQINKTSFYKNKKLFNTYDTDVSKKLISKNNFKAEKAYLNTLLNIMMMITLDHYV